MCPPRAVKVQSCSYGLTLQEENKPFLLHFGLTEQSLKHTTGLLLVLLLEWIGLFTCYNRYSLLPWLQEPLFTETRWLLRVSIVRYGPFPVDNEPGVLSFTLFINSGVCSSSGSIPRSSLQQPLSWKGRLGCVAKQGFFGLMRGGAGWGLFASLLGCFSCACLQPCRILH